MKAPTGSLVQRIIHKHLPERKNSADDEQWLCMGRSSTSDASSGALQRDIDAMRGSEEELDM